MILTFQKSFLVLLLSIVFIGQSLSATIMSYQMISHQLMDSSVVKPSMQSNSEMMSEHCLTLKKKSAVNKSPVNDSDGNSNCCEQHCDCLFTTSASMMDLVSFMHAEPIVLYSTKISFWLAPLLRRQIISPYRPPIIQSIA